MDVHEKIGLADLVENCKLPKTYIEGKILHFLHEGFIILKKKKIHVTWGGMKNNLSFVFFQVAYLHGKCELRSTMILMK